MVPRLESDLYPYVVFLPSNNRIRILRAIFGSKAAVEILRFSLKQGIENKIYKKDLVNRLKYSNKTIIKNLKSLTSLGILNESMEKAERETALVWVKVYELSESGKWLVMLLTKEDDLSTVQKAEILRDLFRTYVKWVRRFSEKLGIDKNFLSEVFAEEMRK